MTILDTARPSTEPAHGRGAAVFASIVVHVLFIGLVLIIGFDAVANRRPDPPPLMVADWTPPPPAAVTDAPPELPVPGGARLVAGPAMRGRMDSATAASDAAQQLARLAPPQRLTVDGPGPRVARPLGFGAAPTDSLRAAGFAVDRTRVAFVLDASGPMVGVLQAARHELARRLAQLTPDQQYVVVVVRGDGCETVPQTPASATRASVDRTLRWLAERAEPRGRADLGAGLDCAWNAINPDAVCIIARGAAAGPNAVHGPNEARGSNAASGSTATRTSRNVAGSVAATSLVATADRLNPSVAGRRQSTFLCIELLDSSPDGALKTVAQTHGGPRGYLLLARAELGLMPRPSAPRGAKLPGTTQ